MQNNRISPHMQHQELARARHQQFHRQLVEMNNRSCSVLEESLSLMMVTDCSQSRAAARRKIGQAIEGFKTTMSSVARPYIESVPPSTTAAEQQSPLVVPTTTGGPLRPPTARHCRIGSIHASPIRMEESLSSSSSSSCDFIDQSIIARIQTSIVVFNMALSMHHRAFSMEEDFLTMVATTTPKSSSRHKQQYQQRLLDQKQNMLNNILSLRDQCIALYGHARSLIEPIIVVSYRGLTTGNYTVDLLYMSILNNLAVAFFQQEQQQEAAVANDDGMTVCSTSSSTSTSNSIGEYALQEMTLFVDSVVSSSSSFQQQNQQQQQYYQHAVHTFLTNSSRLGARFPKSAPAA